ncbi:site-specific integrase [Methylobacterium sp. CB376]|uniref:site-specific integrase n=1 Tax=unclassified Methylobacterium TaxID=2615210 RepID=UPI002240AB48|nr:MULTISPECIES: site-specific integrase [Methylobacterium]WFT83572.1 site-specific integrase [Methylobacterium nodulans]
MVARYRDDRLEIVAGDSVRRELTILRHCLEVARREWGIPLPSNPVGQIKLPEPSKGRQQRLEAEQAQALILALKRSRVWYLRPLVNLAIETGMRRGELLTLRWANVDLSSRIAYLETTKNGHSRTIPLSPGALSVLKGLPRTDARVFPLTGNAVRLAWERLRNRAGLPELRFHDLRHEAISRFFEIGLSIPEVALISGHRDTRTLMRYTHLRPEVLAKKLQQARDVGQSGASE